MRIPSPYLGSSSISSTSMFLCSTWPYLFMCLPLSINTTYMWIFMYKATCNSGILLWRDWYLHTMYTYHLVWFQREFYHRQQVNCSSCVQIILVIQIRNCNRYTPVPATAHVIQKCAIVFIVVNHYVFKHIT